MTAPAASASPPAPAEPETLPAPRDVTADSPPPEAPPAEDLAPPARPRWARPAWARPAVLGATWLVVTLGAVLRVRQWAHGRAFWLDELLLQRAMSQQRISELLAPLGLAQSAPPGWLAVQHAVLGASGSDERAARVLPLLCGIGAVVLTALLARTLLGGPAALLATTLVALSPPLISYSAEFKQYSSDVFLVLLVLLLGARVALRRGRPARGWVALAVTGAVTVWFSHPGALVTLGVFGALGLVALTRRDWRALAAAVVLALPAAAGLAVEYAVLLRRNSDNATLATYWARTFPPDPLTWSATGEWAGQRLASVRVTALAFSSPGLLVALLLAGLLVLGLRRPAALPLVLVPTGVIAAAGLAGAYPIAGRLALFFVPLVALLLAAPLELPRLAARLPGRVLRPAATAVAALAAAAATLGVVVLVEPQVHADWRAVGRPLDKQESRAVLTTLAERRGPRDLLLADGRGARFAAAFYAPRVGAGDFEVVAPVAGTRACLRTTLGDRLRTEGRYDRVWLLAAHTRPTEMAVYRAQLARFGPIAEVISAPGALAIRFDRAVIPPTARPAGNRCVTVADPAG